MNRVLMLVMAAGAVVGVLTGYWENGGDTGMFGSLLAIDMGGYQLSKELARDPLIGSYAGIVATSIFGCTVVFTIPVGMGMNSAGMTASCGSSKRDSGNFHVSRHG